eukprot:sb/3465408/
MTHHNIQSRVLESCSTVNLFDLLPLYIVVYLVNTTGDPVDKTAPTTEEDAASDSTTPRAPKKRRKTGPSEGGKKPATTPTTTTVAVATPGSTSTPAAAPVAPVRKYLVKKSGILRMLSEAVKSYPEVAEFIIDQKVVNKNGESVSALTFIMDNLLAAPAKDSSTTTSLTKESTHEYAKLLLSTVAASNSSEDAKERLVDQMRLSFVNSLNSQECPAKHGKIQALAGLLSTILDSRLQGDTPLMFDRFQFNTTISSQSPPYISKLLIAKDAVSWSDIMRPIPTTYGTAPQSTSPLLLSSSSGGPSSASSVPVTTSSATVVTSSRVMDVGEGGSRDNTESPSYDGHVYSDDEDDEDDDDDDDEDDDDDDEGDGREEEEEEGRVNERHDDDDDDDNMDGG